MNLKTIAIASLLCAGCAQFAPTYNEPVYPDQTHVKPIVDHSKELPDRNKELAILCTVFLPICAYSIAHHAVLIAALAPVWIPAAIIQPWENDPIPEPKWDQDYAFESWRGVNQGGGA